VSTGNKLPVGERAGGTAASVPAHTEGSGVSLPPPHQSLHAAATHNPELAHAHARTHTHIYIPKAPSETSQRPTCSSFFVVANNKFERQKNVSGNYQP